MELLRQLQQQDEEEAEVVVLQQEEEEAAVRLQQLLPYALITSTAGDVGLETIHPELQVLVAGKLP